jgi:trans-feruloyl-CoA hydratase/vanillin synthase
MNSPEAEDYLDAKVEALRFQDRGEREKAVKQFLDDKSYRPGFGGYDTGKTEK